MARDVMERMWGGREWRWWMCVVREEEEDQCGWPSPSPSLQTCKNTILPY